MREERERKGGREREKEREGGRERERKREKEGEKEKEREREKERKRGREREKRDRVTEIWLERSISEAGLGTVINVLTISSLRE